MSLTKGTIHCDELLTVIGEDYEPEYDVMLIDEAQDLPSSFFRLVYANVKSPKRIIWAYDELQNLSTVKMPSLEEMFGVDVDGNLRMKIKRMNRKEILHYQYAIEIHHGHLH